MAHDVFVSHSSEDKPTADAVVARLEAAGVRCWVAPRDVTPGRPWGAEIVDAIETSRVMVLVFSKQADDSEQVLREVTIAVNRGVVVMPLRIEDVMPSEAMEYFLTTPHWLDALTPPLDAHLNKLVDSVRSLLGTPAPHATEAAPATKSFPGALTQTPAPKRRPVVFVGAALALVAAAVGATLAVSRIGRSPAGSPSQQTTTTTAPATGARQVDPVTLLAHARTLDAPTHRQHLQDIVAQVLSADPANAEAKALGARAEMYDPAWWVRAAITGGTPAAATPTIGLRPGTWAQIALTQVRLGHWDEALATLKRHGPVVERFGVLQSVAAVAGQRSADVDVEALLRLRADQFATRGLRLESEEVETARNALFFEVFAARLGAGDVAGATKLMAAHPPPERATPEWYAKLVPAQVSTGDTAGAAATLRDWAALVASRPTSGPTTTTAAARSTQNRRTAAEDFARLARAQAVARDLAGLEKTVATLRTLAAPTGSFQSGHEEADWWARVANLRAIAGDMTGARAAARAFDAAQATEQPADPTTWTSTFIVAVAEARIGDLAAVRRRIGEHRGGDFREEVIGGVVDFALARGEWDRALEWADALHYDMDRAETYVRIARAAQAKKERDVFDRSITAIRAIAGPDKPAVVWYVADFGLAGAYLAAGDRSLAVPIVRDLPDRAFDLMAPQPPASRGLSDTCGPAANLLVRAGAWDRLPDAVLQDISDPDERARACLGVARGLIDELTGAPPITGWREKLVRLEDVLDPVSDVEKALQ